jgi:hypothetical protein
MLFDRDDPLKTDPVLAGPHAWLPSRQPGAYYSWAQPVAYDVELHPTASPVETELGHGAFLQVYYGALKQELLYRVSFRLGLPPRFLLKPEPYCMFWSFGTEGGQSKSVRYHYRDRFLSLHEWTDKGSYLAVLRQHHYASSVSTIWTR